ncbi:ATPase, T2SS/T4P/T4SS family, partial [Xanthomonas phaseoli]
IRKRASRVFSLADYAAKGMLRPGYRPQRDSQPDYWDTARDPVEAINGAIRNRANILVVGGTSSGKTTLANAVLGAIAALCPDDRVVAIEDTVELQIPVRNHVALRTSENVSMARLLRATMRLRPDRIGVGEVRGGEAFTLAKAWNSGHPGGFGTIHADSAVEGLDKFGLYIYEAPEARSLSPDIIGRTVASAVNLVIFIEKTSEEPGRLVTEICRVRGYGPTGYDLEPLVVQPLDR